MHYRYTVASVTLPLGENPPLDLPPGQRIVSVIEWAPGPSNLPDRFDVLVEEVVKEARPDYDEFINAWMERTRRLTAFAAGENNEQDPGNLRRAARKKEKTMTPLPGDFACRNMGGTGMLISFGEWLNGDVFKHAFDPDNPRDDIYYDHAEIFVGRADKNGPYGYTMGAYPSGAHLVPLRKDQLEDGNGFLWSTGRIPLSERMREQIVYNALLCKGIPYSFADYLALALHHFKIPVPELKEYIASTHSMICSQLVDWCYKASGVQLFNDGRWYGYVTPADLANLILGGEVPLRARRSDA